MKKLYMLKFGLWVILSVVTIGSVAGQQTWYALNSGNWDDNNNWTLDPAAAVYYNPDDDFPKLTTDNVVIKSGVTIIVPVKEPAIALNCGTITVDGRLNLGLTSGHTFAAIRGNGRVLMQGDNFPAGDATHFITKGQGGGTVVFQGSSFNLSTPRTYYNIEVEMATGQILGLGANITLNNNLKLVSGTLNFGNNSTARSLVVKGDVIINSGFYFGVSSFNAIHSMDVYGDFSNEGTVQFSNSAQYAAATTGAVKIAFKGASNNVLTANGITNFYRMFVDKGTDNTYMLTAHSNNTNNFKLYGPISGNQGSDVTDGPGGWERLALVLKKGTLKLESNINIPRLGENRTGDSPTEFHIPYTASLWVNGANVATSDAAGGWRGITVYGKLRVSAGTFTNPANTGGITYFSNTGSPGLLLIEGTGKVFTTQLKQAETSGQFNYVQSGGELHINALSDSRISSAVFALPQSSHVFDMSGGKIIIDAINTTATNGIHIGVGEGNANVTGGTFEIKTPTLGVAGQPQFEINSTAPFYNLTISQSAHSGTQTVVLQDDLTVLNDLTIGSNTVFNTSGHGLSIGGSLTNNGVFNHTGTLTFNSNKNSVFANNNGSLTIDALLLNKAINDAKLEFGGTGTFIINNYLDVQRGTLDLMDEDVSVKGNMSLFEGSILSSGTGKISLNGSSKQSLYSELGKDKSFGVIELDVNSTVPQVELLSHVKVESLHFLRNQIVHTGIYNLEIASSLTKAATVSWGNTTSMFRTSGLSSDGGLTLPIVLNGNYSTTSVQYFPIGVLDTDNTPNNRFTPGEVFANGTGLNSSGSITMKPVVGKHPTSNPTATVLPYYWSIDYSGLNSITKDNLRYYLTYDKDLANGFEKSGAVLTDLDWNFVGNVRSDDRVYRFPYSAALNTDFTLGKNSDYNRIRTIYSRATGLWDDKETWSLTSHTGDKLKNGDNFPQAGDIIKIGNGHCVNVADGGGGTIISVGELIFDHDTLVSKGFEDIPRLQVERGNTMNLNRVSGTGMLTQWIDNNRDPVINGDLGDFASQKYSWFLYVGTGAETEITLPTTPAIYPNLALEGGGKKLIATRNIIVSGNVNPRGNSTLLLNNGTSGDIIINGNLVIGDYLDGALEFPAGNNGRTLIVKGDVDFTGSVSSPTNARRIIVTNDTGTALHKMVVNGNIIQGVGVLDLFNAANRPKVDLYWEGSQNSYFNRSGTETTELYRMFTNKQSDKYVEFQSTFSLGGASSEAIKPFSLLSGTAWLNNSNINISLSSGGSNFKIPAGSVLRVDNGATVEVGGAVSNTGIWLDGGLVIDNGSKALINQGSGAFTNNYIEYSASGNASIWVGENAELTVGSQIRRTTTTDAGILNFTQAKASSVISIGTKSAPVNNRGVFEILNEGSSFSQTEANSIVSVMRAQTSPSVAALYFNPAVINIATGSGFMIGGAVDGQVVGLYAGKPLQNLILSATNNPVAKVMTSPLVLNESLTISSGATFDANGLDVTIKGDMINSGDYEASGNSIYFSSANPQTISGVSVFYNFIKQGAGVLNLDTNSSITIDNDLDLQSGSFDTGENSVFIKGNASINDGFMTSSSGTSEGFVMQGGDLQQLSGSGTFGRFTIDNLQGVYVPTQSSSVNFSEMLRMKEGVLDIGRNLMIIEKNATIEAINSFSSVNMIQTNLSFTDAGIRKYLPSGAMAEPMVFPIGSSGKYTPVTLTITSNATDNGYIRVKAANEPHITVLDENNVLNYNWTLDASGISGFSASAVMQAIPADALVSAPNTLDDYVAARILAGSSDWNKLDNIYDGGTLIEGFNSTEYQVVFRFNNSETSIINGDYTAGVKTAIPDKVPSYVTIKDGDWTDASTWAVYDPLTGITGDAGVSVPGGGPRGSQIVVNHNLSLPQNFMSSFRTKINSEGKVLVGNTLNHRFGDVSGTGRIVLQSGSIPAGVYDIFFSALGGTMEFAGTGEYDVLSEISTVNSLVFSGSGSRRLANTDLILNGSLVINGPLLINEFGRKISIKRDVDFSSGSFNAKSGDFEMSGSVPQSIGGTASFSGTSALYNLILNNTAGVGLQQPLEVKNHLIFSKGIINSTASSQLILSSTANDVVSGVSSSSYVSGPVVKNINNGSNFAFPIGKDERFGQVLLNSDGINGLWTAEYFNSAASDRGSFDESIKYVSNNEYWQVTAPISNVNAVATLRWDANSGVNPDDAAFRVVSSIGSVWSAVDYSDKTGSMSSGTVKTTTLNYASTRRFTFGSSSIDPYTWDGITNDWFTGSNWTGGAVPSASNNAIVATSSINPVIFNNDGAIAQTNDLIVNSGALLTLNPGGKLTVNGDLTIADVGGLVMKNTTEIDGLASLMTNGSISGEARIELEFPYDEWYYVSQPIEDATSDIYALLDGGGNFRASEAWVNVHRANRWYRIGAGVSLADMEGLSNKYRLSGGGNHLVFYPGKLNNGPKARSFPNQQFYLMGNPYPSAINWQSDAGWVRNNIGGTIWYRTRVNNEMAFVTYNRFADPGARAAIYPDQGTFGDEEILAYIPPLQSVWISSLGAGSISIDNDARSHAPTGTFLKSSSSQRGTGNVVRIIAENASSYDGAVLYFSENADEGIDRGDSEKMFNESVSIPEVYTRIGEQAMAINGLPLITETSRTIPLSVRNRQEGEVTLRFDLQYYSGTHAPYFEDLETGDFINLLQEPDYTYTVSEIGEKHDRFVLHFYYVTTDLETPGPDETDAGSAISIKSIGGKVLVSVGMELLQNGAGIVEIYTLEGRKLTEIPARSSRTLVILPEESNVYIIRARFGNQVKSEQVIGVMK